jgi:hypothetical protein
MTKYSSNAQKEDPHMHWEQKHYDFDTCTDIKDIT